MLPGRLEAKANEGPNLGPNLSCLFGSPVGSRSSARHTDTIPAESNPHYTISNLQPGTEYEVRITPFT